MSLIGAIRWSALRALQPNNTSIVLKKSQQLPLNGSNRWLKTLQNQDNQVPDKPKRPQTSYNMFYKDLAARLRQQNPSMSVPELAKSVGNEWRSLNPSAKQEFMDTALKNSLQYKDDVEKWREALSDKQMESYLSQLRSRKRVLARRRLRSELKRSEHPIGPKSAFNLYVKEAIENRAHSSEPFVDVFKKIVAKWKTMSPLEREPYIESSKSDKIRYLQEMEIWKKGMESAEKKDMFDRLAKLKSLSSRSVGIKNVKKTKKSAKKGKAKTLSKTTKSKTRAKPKSLKPTSKSKSASKAKSTTKSTAKSSTKPKKSTKAEKSAKQESDSSSDEEIDTKTRK